MIQNRLTSPLAALSILAAILVPARSRAQQTRADAEKDPVLKAMLEERQKK